MKRPLIVTDRGIAALPMLAEVQVRARRACGRSLLRRARQSGEEPGRRRRRRVPRTRADCVIGFGGGAALDVAKAVALMASHPGDLLEYAWDHPQVRPIDQPLPHFVALADHRRHRQRGRPLERDLGGRHAREAHHLLADAARKAVFADPELTLDLPRGITAATGMDALTHNVESYLSPAYHPLCDGIALEGVRIAARALPRAYANGRDLAARSDMLMASMMGAIAFQKDLGAVHSCAHALSTVNDLHHGLANGVMIDHVMRFNRSAAAEKMDELARVAGVPDFIDWLERLKAELGIPAKLARARRECRSPAAPGRHCGEGHLPPDQPAPVHARRFRAAVPRRAVIACCASRIPPTAR